jgi:hypothetical protein
VLPDLFLFFLFLVQGPFIPFFLEPAPRPRERESKFVLEYWFVVDVLDGLDLGYDCLSIVRYLLGEVVVLQVDNCDAGQLH